jgi:hypothetical protein
MDQQQLNNLRWRKSRASGSGGGQCIEVASDRTATFVRDTKSRERGHITVTHQAFAEFVARVKRGELDA